MSRDALNLIPDDYRDERRARRILAWFALLFGVFVFAIGGARVWIDREQESTALAIAQLQSDINYSATQQQQLDELNQTRRELESRVRILEGLRGGLPAEHMFTVIDDTFDASTWFRKWTFRRRGDLTDGEPETVHAGYLIIVPAASTAADSKERAWRLATHMEIAGSALDHTALATFVERLLARAEIADVKILRTGSRREGTREVIDFDIAVTVYTAYEA